MDKKLLIVLFVFFLSLYFITAQGYNENSDVDLRIHLTKRMIEDRTFTVNHPRGVPGKDGKKYSFYGILQSIYFIPFYITGKYITKLLIKFKPEKKELFERAVPEFIVSFSNTPLCAFFGVLLFVFSRNIIGLSVKNSLIASLFLGIASPLWFSSKSLFDSVLSGLLIFSSLFFLFSDKRFIFSSFYTGLFLGLAFLTRVDSILFIISVYFYLIFNNRKKFLPLSAGLLPFLFLWGIYNFIRFGNPLETGYSYEFGFEKGQFIEGYFKIFSFRYLFYHIYERFFSFNGGIFVYSPLFILAIPGIYYFFKKDKKRGLFFIMSISLWVLFYGIYPATGTVMPRFFIPIFPLFAFFSAFSFYKNGKWKKWAIFLFIISFIINFFTILVSYHRPLYEAVINTRYNDSFMQREIIHNRLFYTFNDALYVFKNTFIKRPQKFIILRSEVFGENLESHLKYGLTLNLLNFWWVYLPYFGIPLYLVMPIVLINLLITGITGYFLIKYLSEVKE